jgi:hypothetical protein
MNIHGSPVAEGAAKARRKKHFEGLSPRYSLYLGPRYSVSSERRSAARGWLSKRMLDFDTDSPNAEKEARLG